MMGDRTYVQITVRKDEAKSEAGQDLLGQWGFSLDGSCEESAEDWFAEELNYGGHGFFEDWGDAGRGRAPVRTRCWSPGSARWH